MNRNGFDIGGVCILRNQRDVQHRGHQADAAVSERRGDDVLYPAAGVQSEIDDICSGKSNQKLVSKMRDLMTKDEINAMLIRMKDRTLEWEKDIRFRTESFHEILNNGVNQELIPDDTLSAQEASGVDPGWGKADERQQYPEKRRSIWWKRNFLTCSISNARKSVPIFVMLSDCLREKRVKREEETDHRITKNKKRLLQAAAAAGGSLFVFC